MALSGLATTGPAIAGSLQVEPVLVEVRAPGGASSVTLRNQSAAPIDAQIRVFRWSQTNGEEKLEPTQDVVASPPALSLHPNTPQVVRVVRIDKGPITREESYRLIVDQLPNLTQQRNGTVNMILRHSIPVFFKPPNVSGPAISWSVAAAGGKLQISVHNKGDRRVRISALQVQDSKGTTLSLGNGLVGYALAGSTMRWSAPLGKLTLGQGAISISAQGDTGPIHAAATTAPSH
jgi:fimbrial chaperone protein